MAIKYVFTFSNNSNGVTIYPDNHGSLPLDYLTRIFATCDPKNFSNATGIECNGFYKGVPEKSFRLEYIVADPVRNIEGYAAWIAEKFQQDCVLLETYSEKSYNACLVDSKSNIIQI